MKHKKPEELTLADVAEIQANVEKKLTGPVPESAGKRLPGVLQNAFAFLDTLEPGVLLTSMELGKVIQSSVRNMNYAVSANPGVRDPYCLWVTVLSGRQLRWGSRHTIAAMKARGEDAGARGTVRAPAAPAAWPEFKWSKKCRAVNVERLRWMAAVNAVKPPVRLREDFIGMTAGDRLACWKDDPDHKIAFSFLCRDGYGGIGLSANDVEVMIRHGIAERMVV